MWKIKIFKKFLSLSLSLSLLNSTLWKLKKNYKIKMELMKEKKKHQRKCIYYAIHIIFINVWVWAIKFARALDIFTLFFLNFKV